jgi:hypothetical protein
MLSKRLKEKYLEYLTEVLANYDYSDIDGFVENEELDEAEIEELLDIILKVVEE